MLDLIIPPAAYAEEQPYSRFILGTHVIHRGFNMGAILGIGSSLAINTFRKVRVTGYTYSFNHTLRFAARGGLFGLAFGALALGGRMYGRDLIEWQDRSWRLLQHPTQNQTDHWSIAGATAGAITGAMYRSTTPRALMGGAAMGSAAAIVTMMVVRAVRGEKKVEEAVIPHQVVKEVAQKMPPN